MNTIRTFFRNFIIMKIYISFAIIRLLFIIDYYFITDEVFEILFPSNQIDLESMKRNEFVFDFVDGLHFKCYKISLNSGGSHIDSSVWLNNKKATLNPNL